MNGYTETLDRFATGVGDQLVAAWDAWQAHKITDAEFVAVATAYLQAGDAQATALADTALAAFLTIWEQKPIPTLGMATPELDHKPRVLALVAAQAAREQWHSYGRSSALARGQDAYADAMVAQSVPAWTRIPNGGACKVCTDLTGDVLPAEVPMWHHNGCGCTQQPVIERN